MTNEQILKVLKNERECIKRQSGVEAPDGSVGICDRNCAKCDLCLPDDEILEVYDFLINGYELLQNEGAEEYCIRLDTKKLSQEELDNIIGSIKHAQMRAVSIETDIKPLSPDVMRKIMGMEGTD